MRALALVLALAAVPATAAAQTPDAVDPHVGLFGGLSLQAGNLSCSGQNCNEFRKAGGGDVHVGWGLNGKLALMGDVYALTSKENSLSITQWITTVGARYWVVPVLWVQGGVGGAFASYRYDTVLGSFSGHTDNAAALLLAAGFELIKGKRFELDVEARFGYGFYADNNNDGQPDNTGRSTSLGVGVTWY